MAETFAHTLSELHAPSARTATTLPARRLDDALEALRARTGAVSIVVIDGNSPVLWGSSEPGHELVNVDDLARIGASLSVARDRGLTLDQLALQDADALITALRKRGIERAHEELLSMLVTRDGDESSQRHRLLTTLAIASVRQKMHRGEHVRSVHHEPQFGYIARGFANIGAWILGRNMFGPVRGPWPDESWKGWWGDTPPYHCNVFVLTHHPRAPLSMDGGTTFHFVTDGIESAYAQAEATTDRPTAIMFATDRNALGFIPVVTAAGLGVPRDVAVVGFDNVEAGAFTVPALTTVNQRFDSIGSLAGRLLLDELRGGSPEPARHALPSHVVARASCGCAPATTCGWT